MTYCLETYAPKDLPAPWVLEELPRVIRRAFPGGDARSYYFEPARLFVTMVLHRGHKSSGVWLQVSVSSAGDTLSHDAIQEVKELFLPGAVAIQVYFPKERQRCNSSRVQHLLTRLDAPTLPEALCVL